MCLWEKGETGVLTQPTVPIGWPDWGWNSALPTLTLGAHITNSDEGHFGSCPQSVTQQMSVT